VRHSTITSPKIYLASSPGAAEGEALGWMTTSVKRPAVRSIVILKTINLQNLVSFPGTWRVKCPHTSVNCGH
jgi:hypothetical protein